MQRRKHTHCGACHKKTRCRRLELHWQLDCEGAWTCVLAWICGGCCGGGLPFLRDIGVQLTLWDEYRELEHPTWSW